MCVTSGTVAFIEQYFQKIEQIFDLQSADTKWKILNLRKQKSKSSPNKYFRVPSSESLAFYGSIFNTTESRLFCRRSLLLNYHVTSTFGRMQKRCSYVQAKWEKIEIYLKFAIHTSLYSVSTFYYIHFAINMHSQILEKDGKTLFVAFYGSFCCSFIFRNL